MTPADAIGMLNRQIAAHGQEVKFRRGAAPVRALRAFVRGFKANEIGGLLQQGDRQVVLSPTGLDTEPAAQDKISIAGSPATIQSVERVHISDTLVRLNLVVRG